MTRKTTHMEGDQMVISFIRGLVIALMASSLAQAKSNVKSNIETRVIYGEDNRQEVYQVERADMRDVADSTAAMISTQSFVKGDNGKLKIKSRILGKELSLCKDEPFYDQPSAANCSAFLVGEDMVATAGHCVNKNTCANYSFAFNYRMIDEKTAPTEADENDVYQCQKVLAHELTGNQDYALVKLDRPVRGRRVLQLMNRSVQVGDDMVVIGHPSGIPTKVAAGAQVRALKDGFFVSNLDTYGGNSGSAVFNANTLEVAGILVRGVDDYNWDSVNKCRRSNICPSTGCAGEDSTHISYVVEALKNVR